jgi:hypothetical protein
MGWRREGEGKKAVWQKVFPPREIKTGRQEKRKGRMRETVKERSIQRERTRKDGGK